MLNLTKMVSLANIYHGLTNIQVGYKSETLERGEFDENGEFGDNSPKMQ